MTLEPFFAKDKSEPSISGLKEALYLLEVSQNTRKKLDNESPKYNFMVTLTILQENLITKISKVGELCFVDLVGAERINDVRACKTEKEINENRSINKALLNLARIIEQMSKGQRADFRSSTLTK